MNTPKTTPTAEKKTPENIALDPPIRTPVAFEGFFRDVTCHWSCDDRTHKVRLTRIFGKPVVFLNGRFCCKDLTCSTCYGCKNLTGIAKVNMEEFLSNCFDNYFNIILLDDSETSDESLDLEYVAHEDESTESEDEDLGSFNNPIVIGKRKRTNKKNKENKKKRSNVTQKEKR